MYHYAPKNIYGRVEIEFNTTGKLQRLPPWCSTNGLQLRVTLGIM